MARHLLAGERNWYHSVSLSHSIRFGCTSCCVKGTVVCTAGSMQRLSVILSHGPKDKNSICKRVGNRGNEEDSYVGRMKQKKRQERDEPCVLEYENTSIR